MKLLDYLKTVEAGSEITVWDNTYDIEVYFYTFAKYHHKDEWDKAMDRFASKLDVVAIKEDGVIVNMYDLIDKNVSNIKDLFYACDTDSIMDDMENILAGCVQESWMSKFVDALEA